MKCCEVHVFTEMNMCNALVKHLKVNGKEQYCNYNPPVQQLEALQRWGTPPYKRLGERKHLADQ